MTWHFERLPDNFSFISYLLINSTVYWFRLCLRTKLQHPKIVDALDSILIGFFESCCRLLLLWPQSAFMKWWLKFLIQKWKSECLVSAYVMYPWSPNHPNVYQCMLLNVVILICDILILDNSPIVDLNRLNCPKCYVVHNNNNNTEEPVAPFHSYNS